jgi:plasmid stability protein
MAQVIVRNLSDDVVRRLRRKAEFHGRSLEQELREILTGAARLSARREARPGPARPRHDAGQSPVGQREAHP